MSDHGCADSAESRADAFAASYLQIACSSFATDDLLRSLSNCVDPDDCHAHLFHVPTGALAETILTLLLRKTLRRLGGVFRELSEEERARACAQIQVGLREVVHTVEDQPIAEQYLIDVEPRRWTSGAYQYAATRDERLLLGGHTSVHLLDLAFGSHEVAKWSFDAPVSALALGPAGFAIVGTVDGRLTWCDPNNLATFTGAAHAGPVLRVVACDDGTVYSAARSDGVVQSAPEGPRSSGWSLRDVTAFDADPRTRTLVCGCAAGVLLIRRPHQRIASIVDPVPRGPVMAVHVAGGRIGVVLRSGELRVLEHGNHVRWGVEGGVPRRALHLLGSRVLADGPGGTFGSYGPEGSYVPFARLDGLALWIGVAGGDVIVLDRSGQVWTMPLRAL